MRLVILILIVSLVPGCTLQFPEIESCNIINKDVAECVPSNPNKPIHDKQISEMRGYKCYSNPHVGEIKKYIKKAADRIQEL